MSCLLGRNVEFRMTCRNRRGLKFRLCCYCLPLSDLTLTWVYGACRNRLYHNQPVAAGRWVGLLVRCGTLGGTTIDFAYTNIKQSANFQLFLEQFLRSLILGHSIPAPLRALVLFNPFGTCIANLDVLITFGALDCEINAVFYTVCIVFDLSTSLSCPISIQEY